MRLTRRTFTAGLIAAFGGAGSAARGQVPSLIAPKALQADFDELYVRLERAHYNLFAHTVRAQQDSLHAALRPQLGRAMSLAEARSIFQRFVAAGRVAHCRIDAASEDYRAHMAGGGRAFPLTLRIKGARVFVMANASGLPDIEAGDEVVAINRVPAIEFIDALWREVSADTAYMFHSMVEWMLPRLMWQRSGPREAFDLSIRRSGGAARLVRVPARSRAQMEAVELQPPPLKPELADRTYRIIDSVLGYFRPGPFYAAENPEAMYDNRAFVRLVDEAFERFTSARVPRLLLDLRDNPGGDNSFSDHMVAWFAKRPFRFTSAFRIKVTPETVASNRARLAVPGNDPTGMSAALDRAYAGVRTGRIVDFPIPITQPRRNGRYGGEVFVLINRHSYSNAVSVASLIQDYGFGTIMGEETSDLATTYGAMETFALSRTGIVVGYPKARIVRASGSLVERGVVPDIPIDTPVVETVDDPVLQRAIAAARSARPRPT